MNARKAVDVVPTVQYAKKQNEWKDVQYKLWPLAQRVLPIVVTEFAGAIFNLMIFSHLLGDAPVALMLDALVVPMVLVSKGASPMMQWMHRPQMKHMKTKRKANQTKKYQTNKQ